MNYKVDILRKYREEYGSEMPTLKLARIIYQQEPLLYKNVEVIRTQLRYIDGKKGDKAFQSTKDTKFITPNRPLNPYNLPNAEKINYENFIIEGKKILILSDIHIPYHDISALTVAIDYGIKVGVDSILLNGDTLDFFTLSRFAKDPKGRSFAHELLMFEEFIKALKIIFPQAKIYFKVGNHEERYNHYLWMKAGELEGVSEFKLEEIIKRRAEGVVMIGDKRIIKVGDLNIIHGHEFGGSIFSPVNIARGLFLRAKVGALQGHNHQTSEHTERDMNGRITTTYSVGCLCQLSPAYLPLNKWNHGFAIVEVDGYNFDVQNKRINDGKII